VSTASAWKTFYDQIFSAFSANVQSTNPHIAGVVAFLKKYGIALYHDTTFEATSRLSKPPPFDLRQTAADEMRRAVLARRRPARARIRQTRCAVSPPRSGADPNGWPVKRLACNLQRPPRTQLEPALRLRLEPHPGATRATSATAAEFGGGPAGR